MTRLRLVGGKPEIDAGVDLANLNDAFALSASPDIGAFEYGEPAPHYGPRAPNLDLSASLKRVNRTVTFFGNPVTYTIELRNTGASLANTVYLTDDMPGGVRLIDGSCTVLPAGGMGSLPILPPTKCQDNVVTWQGSLTETFAMTFTFVVTIAVTEPAVIVNNVVIAASGTPATQRSAVIVANGHAVYLPLFVGGRAP